ncbi:hypothetical protein ANRL3_02797 [Anaerolineae bacterium]|nr:hypothetical protein ANRL3_02797 [Anaerolineae bacterium]
MSKTFRVKPPRETASGSCVGVTPELIGSVSFGGLRAYGLGYAVDLDTDATIYLSLVGYRTAVRGVWAALMDNRAVELSNQVLRRAEGTYVSKTVQLPESGLDHIVLLHHQAAIPHLEPGQSFYVLNGNDTPPIEQFVAMLDRATAVPLLPTWGAELWRQGVKNKLIDPLADTRSVEGWRVSADSELWLALIEKGIQRGVLMTAAKEVA